MGSDPLRWELFVIREILSKNQRNGKVFVEKITSHSVSEGIVSFNFLRNLITRPAASKTSISLKSKCCWRILIRLYLASGNISGYR